MRRRGEGFKGVMEFLIGTAALDLQKEGAEFVSLSGAPLAQANPGEEQVGVQKLLEVVGKTMEPVYGFRSLLNSRPSSSRCTSRCTCATRRRQCSPHRSRHLPCVPAEHDLRAGGPDDGSADLNGVGLTTGPGVADGQSVNSAGGGSEPSLPELPLTEPPVPELLLPESPLPESPLPESPLPESPLPESPLPESPLP